MELIIDSSLDFVIKFSAFILMLLLLLSKLILLFLLSLLLSSSIEATARLIQNICNNYSVKLIFIRSFSQGILISTYSIVYLTKVYYTKVTISILYTKI